MFWTALIPLLEPVIKNVFPDKEQQDKALLELMAMQHTADAKMLEHRMSAIVAEANSEDPWTSRARPSFLYVIYLILVLCVLGSIIGIWHPAEMKQAAENMGLLFNAIPDPLYALFGAGYLGYTGAREYGKSKKTGSQKLPWQ